MRGIIALSACLAGEVPRAITRGNYEEAKEIALKYQKCFGKDNYFLELQDHGIPEQQNVNQHLLRLSQELGIELVATNDIHYTYAEDAEPHDILLCIQTGKKLADEDRMRYEGGTVLRQIRAGDGRTVSLCKTGLGKYTEDRRPLPCRNRVRRDQAAAILKSRRVMIPGVI